MPRDDDASRCAGDAPAGPTRAAAPSAAVGLYPGLLGSAWTGLDAAVQRFHRTGEALHAAGAFRVRHGDHPFGRLLIRLLRLPPPGEAVPIS